LSIARRDSSNNVFYYFADHLGTSREMVQSGQTSSCYDADFLPYGQEVAYTNGCGSRYKFTTKERDTETGNDNLGARYHRSLVGRFLSPDSVTMLPERLRDPQQINLYSYARNNPLRFVDPTGTTIDDSACQANKKCKGWEAKYKKSKQGLAQWQKLDDDKNLLVKLQWDSKGQKSVTSDYKWDSKGNLTGATVTLAPHTADTSTQMDPISYPFGSTLTDSGERQVYVFGHELGHVEDAQTTGGRNSILQIDELFPAAQARYDAEGISGYEKDQDLQSIFSIIRADNKRNENVADQRAKGIVESYRACTSGKDCQ
jgi:RHS repeat-associated protein